MKDNLARKNNLTLSAESREINVAFCKNFDEKTCLVPVRAVFDIDGSEIRPVSKDVARKAEKRQCVFEAVNRIFLLKQSNSHYRLITGVLEFQNILAKGNDLISAVVYEVEAEKFTSAANCILSLKRKQNLHFFDYSILLGKLIELTDVKQTDLAAWLRISQPSVGNKLRLLGLSDDVRGASVRSRLTERHCRALLAIEKPEFQLRAINYIVKYNISSKETESITKYLHSQRRLGISDEEYSRLFDNAFLNATVDTKSEVTSFQNNIMREVRILRSLGIDVVYTQLDKNTYWNIEITLPKSA